MPTTVFAPLPVHPVLPTAASSSASTVGTASAASSSAFTVGTDSVAPSVLAAVPFAGPGVGLEDPTPGKKAPKAKKRTVVPTPHPGGLCELLLGGAKHGSKLQAEYQKDLREAHVFFDFLKGFPLLLEQVAVIGGFDLTAAGDVDLLLGGFMRSGSGRTAAARTAMQNLRAFFESTPRATSTSFEQLIIKGLSSADLAGYILVVIKDAREWCKYHDRQCKDTAALGRINDMKAFVSITGIPVADFENKTVLKLLPAPPKSGKVPVRSSTVSVFVACHFENVANTHASPFVRHVAGVGSIADKFGMRGRETLRTVVVKNVSGPQCGADEIVERRCEAGKSATRKEMYSFNKVCYPEGYLRGGSTWIHETLARAASWPSLIMACTDDEGNPVPIFEATKWSQDVPMSDAHLHRAWVDIQLMIMSAEDIKASMWDVHGPHSFGANVIRAQLGEGRFDTVDLCEVSRWADPGESALRGSSMAIRYTGAAGVAVELDLRRRVCRSVSDFIGERDWMDVVPRQRGEVPTFDFLVGRTEAKAKVGAASAESDADSVDEPPEGGKAPPRDVPPPRANRKTARPAAGQLGKALDMSAFKATKRGKR